MTDTLAIARNLEASGLDRERAEAIATAIGSSFAPDLSIVRWALGLLAVLGIGAIAWLTSEIAGLEDKIDANTAATATAGERLARVAERQAAMADDLEEILERLPPG